MRIKGLVKYIGRAPLFRCTITRTAARLREIKDLQESMGASGKIRCTITPTPARFCCTITQARQA